MKSQVANHTIAALTIASVLLIATSASAELASEELDSAVYQIESQNLAVFAETMDENSQDIIEHTLYEPTDEANYDHQSFEESAESYATESLQYPSDTTAPEYSFDSAVALVEAEYISLSDSELNKTSLSELERMLTAKTTQEISVKEEVSCPLSHINLFIGKDGLHLFMCAEITYGCTDNTTKVVNTAFGAVSVQDQADCQKQPRPAHIAPFNATLEGLCDADPKKCLSYINTIGHSYSNTNFLDLFIAPVNGAPCANAVKDFVCYLQTGKPC